MTRHVRIDTPRSAFADHEKRIYELERKLRARQEDTRPSLTRGALCIFNLNGTLSVSASDHFPIPTSCQLTVVRARLKTAGSSTTTAVLKANASTTVAPFSFSSSSVTPSSNPTVANRLTVDDYLWLDVTAAGTSAAGLVLAVWAEAV